jgi:hypothetical protein
MCHETDSFLADCELSHEKAFDRIREKDLLGLFAVLIHDVAHQTEVEIQRVIIDRHTLTHAVLGLNYKYIVFIMAVSEYYQKHAQQKLLLLSGGQLA